MYIQHSISYLHVHVHTWSSKLLSFLAPVSMEVVEVHDQDTPSNASETEETEKLIH